VSRFKYRSERRAWIWAAHDAKAYRTGLCSGLWQLYYKGLISERMYDKMMAKIQKARPGVDLDAQYFWPTTDEGQAKRLAFARRQAARCTNRRLK
jgi:hypothetical protein